MRNLLLALFFLISIDAFARGGSHHGGGDRHSGGDHRGGESHEHHDHERYNGHGDGHVRGPVRLYLGSEPRDGWHGRKAFYNNYYYNVWSWRPYAPFYAWGYYSGWRLGLYYYVPDGLKCFADNTQVQGEWSGREQYYESDDAINSALGFCETDPAVQNAGAQGSCRIKNCVRW